jgi:hypothetical protein
VPPLEISIPTSEGTPLSLTNYYYPEERWFLEKSYGIKGSWKVYTQVR